MAILSVNNYSDTYEKVYVSQYKKTEAEKKKEVKAESNQSYVKKLRSKVPYIELETGYGLNMRKDKKMRKGKVTINPELLEKMKKDPESEKKYTQLVKDIERAEKTADAYYNSIGGVVERTSHWYIDENGKYYHFAYTRRDDRLNKKIRMETKKNTEKWIEKSRQKARKRAKEQEEKQEEKAEKAKEKEGKSEDALEDQIEELLAGKFADSEDGSVYLDEEDMKSVMDAIQEENMVAGKRGSQGNSVGTNMDLRI